SGVHRIQLDGIHSVSHPAAYRWRYLWNAFSRYGMGLCGHWPCLSFHGGVRRSDALLLEQQKTSSVGRTPSPVRSLLRRISIPVHVLRGYSAFGDRSSAV